MSYFKKLESQLNSPNLLKDNNAFHALDYDTQQLDELLRLVSYPDYPDVGALIPHILARLKKRNLAALIKALHQLESEHPISKITVEIYQIAVINKLNNLKDEAIFDSAASHWSEFTSVKGSHNEDTFKPFSAYLLLWRRLQLIAQKNPVFYDRLINLNQTTNNDSLYKKIITSMESRLHTVYADTSAHLPISHEKVFLPKMQLYSALTLDIKEAWNTLSWLSWNIYYYTVGWVLHPLYLLSMATVDQMRNLTIWLTTNSLTTSQPLKFAITAIGSGSAFVGVVSALSNLGVLPAVSAGVATAGVIVAAAVNLLASADLKDQALSPITLSAIFELCCLAAVASAVLASHGIEKLLLRFKYGDTLPPDAELHGQEKTAAFWSGVVLAAFNCFTSIRSTYGATVRFVNDYFDPRSPFNQLIYGENLTKKGAAYLFMLITFTVVPYVYSVSVTERITNKSFATAIKSELANTLAIFGTAFLCNLTTATIFINRTIDWIYKMYEKEQIDGTKEWLAMIVGMFLIGSFYMLSNYGNGESNAEALWDNEYWSKAIGALMGLSVFGSVWMTIKVIVRELLKSRCVNPAEFNGHRKDEKRLLLPR